MNTHNKIILLIPEDKITEYVKLKKKLEKESKVLKKIKYKKSVIFCLSFIILLYFYFGLSEVFVLWCIVSNLAILVMIFLFEFYPFSRKAQTLSQEIGILEKKIKEAELDAVQEYVEEVFKSKEEGDIRKIVSIIWWMYDRKNYNFLGKE